MVAICPDIPDGGRYNASKTAKLLGISRPTLYDRIERGFIKRHTDRYNGRPFFYGSDIKHYYRRAEL